MAADMSTIPSPLEDPDAIRKQGNEFYRAGNLAEAVNLYRCAIELAPSEATPLSNLSAALFELGDYQQCYESCQGALALRTEESCLLLLDTKKAAAAADLIVAFKDKTQLERCIEGYEDSVSHWPDSRAAHTKIVMELPRYKCMVETVPEYYVLGHDTPTSLYDKSLLESGRDTISMMFGGIGDARHLHMTLGDIHDQENRASGRRPKSFHFTIVDIKAAAIACDLLVLLMFDELADSEADRSKAERSNMVQCTLVYTYLAAIMPRRLHNVLQEHIARAIAAMKGEGALPTFLDVNDVYRADILRVLVEWQNEVLPEYPVPRIRQAVTQECEATAQHFRAISPPNDDSSVAGCKKETAFHRKTGIMALPAPYCAHYEAGICDSFQNFDPSNSSDELIETAIRSADSGWATNPTQFDLEWQHDKANKGELNLLSDLLAFAEHLVQSGLKPRNPRGFHDYTGRWVVRMALALRELRPRITIEACVGDITTVQEQRRYGMLGSRRTIGHKDVKESDEATSDASPSFESGPGMTLYPVAYDRIHLSNVPDYIGGSLTSYVFALPAMYPGPASYITSNCLRNTSRWKSAAAFDNEYVGLNTPPDIAKAFQVRIARRVDNPMSMFDRMLGPIRMPGMYPMDGYHKWHHQPISSALADLTPRKSVRTWLHRLFLKLAIPMTKHDVQDNQLVFSPLNLNMMFRVCIHLHNTGYPAHWLSEILEHLLSGSVVTSARPPRTEPLTIGEVNADMSPMAQSVAPFAAEMITLASIWRTALPFGVLSEHIPSIASVRRYQVPFQVVHEGAGDIPTFALVFYDANMLPANSMLRPFLQDDELADRSRHASAVREKGLHVVTTWDWDRKGKQATFWLRQDVVAQMQRPAQKWAVAVWRTDAWRAQSKPEPVTKICDVGGWLYGE
ncbi:hypothetical protein LTR36_010163 [Oleoguttula mirabilis]|uniref:DUF4470 domain-containing protein n=1 Tax=Oleoguttula mirabilis TaxID=1507867 RepID=A0AAV9JRL0_9PEZI|nr:hypothetical protein LTR36_010163 [Oleoguttula mirabilis]